MTDDPYFYQGTAVLRNKLNIKSAGKLDERERELVTARMMQGVPHGNFDLAHLKAIHKHLFQDIYEWAGQTRTVEIAKGGNQFQFQKYIETGMDDVHRRLVQRNFLKGLSAAEFAREAGKIVGDVNYVHPFREGNGRTQLQYLKQLGAQAGHTVDLSRLKGPDWLEASREAHQARFERMGECIEAALAPGRDEAAELLKSAAAEHERVIRDAQAQQAGKGQGSEPEAERDPGRERGMEP